jgi:predicted GNAT family acetyltransferase
MSDSTPNVVRNEAQNRFEIREGDQIAQLAYDVSGGEIALVHTEVPPPLEGEGYGSALAKAALDYARAQHLHVVPSCPFVAGYIRRHPEYADLTRR